MKTIGKLLLGCAVLFTGLSINLSWGQTLPLIFDGDFESGTFQGWTPSGENGGFVTLAARGTCYSGNDTMGISFNGNEASDYAALLRSNAQGQTGSVAKLRSTNFPAGNGILFQALSETLDPNDTRPSQLTVRILSSTGQALSELPLQTAVIHVAPGCPSVRRDAAFSVHYIDTHQYEGDISIEFTQHTNRSGFGYFTLVDNVFVVPKGQIVVNQSQPIAVAGVSITDSGTLFLDPRSSIDPDNQPNSSLQFSWFIDGEQTIRMFDVPCINVNDENEQFQNITLAPGNHRATLYATDGVNYSADTIRFFIPSSTATDTDTTDDNTDNTDGTTNDNITLTTPKGDPIITVNSPTDGDSTVSDAGNECNVNVTDILDDSDDPSDDGDGNGDGNGDGGTNTVSIDVGSPDVVFTVGGSPVNVTSNNVEIQSSTGSSITSITVTIQSAVADDVLSHPGTPNGLIINPNGASLVISLSNEDTPINDSSFEVALEGVLFEHGAAVVGTRTISYTVNDSNNTNASTTSAVVVQ